MNKLDELERLQKLKESGTLSEKEFITEKNKILQGQKSKRKLPKWLDVIVTVIIVIAVFALIGKISEINDKNDIARNGEKYIQQSTSNTNEITTNNTNKKNNTGYTNDYADKILKKWKITLPSNNTNGLIAAMYDTKEDELYLEYNFGVIEIHTDNSIERYGSNGQKSSGNYLLHKYTNNLMAGEEWYIYMKAKEFEDIIN